jgi:hypothetical protein
VKLLCNQANLQEQESENQRARPVSQAPTDSLGLCLGLSISLSEVAVLTECLLQARHTVQCLISVVYLIHDCTCC